MTFARPTPAENRRRRQAEKRRNLKALATPTRSLHRGVVGGATSGQPVKKAPPARPGKRAPSVAEREWMDWIVVYGCVACRIEGLGFRPAAVHHILRGGRRIGHLSTLPLCDPGHHQGGQVLGMVSRHPWKARFEQRYGSEQALLERLQAEFNRSRP